MLSRKLLPRGGMRGGSQPTLLLQEEEVVTGAHRIQRRRQRSIPLSPDEPLLLLLHNLKGGSSQGREERRLSYFPALDARATRNERHVEPPSRRSADLLPKEMVVG